MRTKILKAVVISLLAVSYSATWTYGGLEVDGAPEGFEVVDTEEFSVVVSINPRNLRGFRIPEDFGFDDPPTWVGITSYTEEYTDGDGVRIKQEVRDIEYNNDGLLVRETIYSQGEHTVIQTDVIEALPGCPSGLKAFLVYPRIMLPVYLGTFVKPVKASDWRVYDIVVSNLDTGEVLGKLKYSSCNTTLELQLINQKLDNIANSVAGVNKRIEANQKGIKDLLWKIYWYVQWIYSYVSPRPIWRRVGRR